MIRTNHLLVDNCSGDKFTEAVIFGLLAISNELLFRLSNIKHSCQPLNYFTALKLRAIWRKE